MNMSSRKRSCDLNEDRISGLPDAILIHILSLLPSKDAANTIFIKRFHKLWPFIHTLNFDQCMFRGRYCAYCRASLLDYDESFLNFIRHVLLLNKNLTIHKFRLKFHFSLAHSFWQRVSGRIDLQKYDFLRREIRMANEIGTWIQFALNRNLKVLDLSFSAHGEFQPQAYYDLPNCVLSSPHLVELRLAFCKINTRKKSELKSLTTLSLDNIMLMDQSMDYILSGCPMLEKLTLWFCYVHRRVVLLHSNLKTLVLGLRWVGTMIHVSCPTLLSLYMDGAVEVLDVSNVASIVDVSVKCMKEFDFREYKDYREMRILLQTITGAKSLKLCSWFALNTLSWIHPYEFDADEYWNMVDTPVHCLTHHLKTVVVAGRVMKKQVIQFLDYLLRHSMVLEEMKIEAEKQTLTAGPIKFFSDAPEYEERLMNAPLASASAAVRFY